MVEKLICDDGVDVDFLVYVIVYLFWIFVGVIACVEDGTYYCLNYYVGLVECMYGVIEVVECFVNDVVSGGDIYCVCEFCALIRRLYLRFFAFIVEFT